MKFKTLNPIMVVALLLVSVVILGACSSDHSHDSDQEQSAQATIIEFPDSAAAVAAETQEMIELLSAGFEDLAAAEPRTFENVILANDYLSYRGYAFLEKLKLLVSLSPSQEIRDAAMSGISALGEFTLALSSDEDIAGAFASFSDQVDNYSGEELLLLQNTLPDALLTDLSPEAVSEFSSLTNAKALLYTQIEYFINAGLDSESTAAFVNYLYVQTRRANILGFDSVASMALQDTMAGTPARAKSYVDEITTAFDSQFNDLVDQLSGVKAAVTGDSQSRITPDDVEEYFDLWAEEKYQVTNFGHLYYEQGIFPLDHVLEALTLISERVFGIRIELSVPPMTPWHDDVMYLVASDLISGELMATLYLDLYDRPGKQQLTVLKQLSAPYMGKGISWRPACVMQANFPTFTEGVPVMLSWSQAFSVFHEFGHFLNKACTKTHYYYTRPQLTTDYAEVMSQLLEKWLGDPEVQAVLQGDQPVISNEEIDNMLQVAAYHDLLDKRRMIARGVYNLSIYSDYSVQHIVDPAFDPLEIGNSISDTYYLPPSDFEDISIYHTWYPATYYGYIWSEDISYDIAQVFLDTDKELMNPELGQRLRKSIFTNAYDFNATEDIEQFLGRSWTSEPFLEKYRSL